MNEDLDLALLQAIAKGDREAVLNLVARGVNVNGRVSDGPTPLDMAVIADNWLSRSKSAPSGNVPVIVAGRRLPQGNN